MTTSTAIVISAFFLALSPALYKLAELASEWVKVRRLDVERRIDAANKYMIDLERSINNRLETQDKEIERERKSRVVGHEFHQKRIEDLEERLIKLNNRVVAGGRKVS